MKQGPANAGANPVMAGGGGSGDEPGPCKYRVKSSILRFRLFLKSWVVVVVGFVFILLTEFFGALLKFALEGSVSFILLLSQPYLN